MKITLKPMVKNDLELILAWRSHPLIYKYFRLQTQPLTWKEHLKFWRSRHYRRDYIIMVTDSGISRKIGTINFSRLDTDTPEIGILIGELHAHGLGIGSKSLLQGLVWLRHKGYKKAQANINRKNLPSIHIFTKAGFIRNPAIKDKEWIAYEKHL